MGKAEKGIRKAKTMSWAAQEDKFYERSNEQNIQKDNEYKESLHM